jgi:hypothetical protein
MSPTRCWTRPTTLAQAVDEEKGISGTPGQRTAAIVEPDRRLVMVNVKMTEESAIALMAGTGTLARLFH